MKKIGICTFHSVPNYGAFLQAYALQSWIQQHAKEAEVQIVDYRPEYLSAPYKRHLSVQLRNQYGVIKKIKCFTIWLIEEPFRIIKKFRFWKARKYLQLTPQAKANGDFSWNDFCGLIFGSDQIWNSDITEGLDEVFFGQIASKACRRVSYAASIGAECFKTEEAVEAVEMLRHFSALGIREQKTAEYFRKQYHLPAEWNVDPTLLMEPAFWKRMVKKTKRAPYILVYWLRNSTPFRDAELLAKRLGKEVLTFDMPALKKRGRDCVKSVGFSGPFDFVNLIANADVVLTDSFHAMCFSLIFERQFFVYLHESRSERITGMAELLNYQDRLITAGQTVTEDQILMMQHSPENYLEHFADYRRKSEEFLRGNIKDMLES